MRFAVETIAQCWDVGQALLEFHWREIALHQDVIPLAPDKESYEDLERHGQLQLVTMRDDEGKLWGYHVSIIRPHLHYRTSLTAFTDVFYIHPDYRKGTSAAKLFKFAEAQLAARGVQRMYATSKLAFDLRPLFVFLGWTEIERVFVKLVEK
jgi:GNAT superfamily N-acetyltransferase